MQEPLISVIIPVYNVEAYLCQCLDSVLNSTYTNLQVILVNDGSTDNCGSICDTYATSDQRLTVLHKKNQGLAEARNSGLALAKGEFVAFVDSDDVVSPLLFETLLWAIQYTNSDISACEYTRTDDAMAYSFQISPERLKIVHGSDGCIQVFSGEPSTREITWTGPMVWNKLYRKDKITATFRTEAIPAEDMQFNWEYGLKCEKMVIVPQALYYWRINANSITQSPNVNKLMNTAHVWINIVQNTDVENALLLKHLRHRAANHTHAAMWRIVEQNQESEYPDFCEQSYYVVREYFQELIAHKDTTIGTRVAYTLYRYGYPIWRLLPKVYKHLRKVYTK